MPAFRPSANNVVDMPSASIDEVLITVTDTRPLRTGEPVWVSRMWWYRVPSGPMKKRS